jgi:hypothetical protein
MSKGEPSSGSTSWRDDRVEVKLPFLEIDEELWDKQQQRLTVLFDPGRIKSGVTPNQEVGMALKTGHKYTLVVDEDWKDAKEIPLKATFKKTFSVGPADRTPIDPRHGSSIRPRPARRTCCLCGCSSRWMRRC